MVGKILIALSFLVHSAGAAPPTRLFQDYYLTYDDGFQSYVPRLEKDHKRPTTLPLDTSVETGRIEIQDHSITSRKLLRVGAKLEVKGTKEKFPELPELEAASPVIAHGSHRSIHLEYVAAGWYHTAEVGYEGNLLDSLGNWILREHKKVFAVQNVTKLVHGGGLAEGKIFRHWNGQAVWIEDPRGPILDSAAYGQTYLVEGELVRLTFEKPAKRFPVPVGARQLLVLAQDTDVCLTYAVGFRCFDVEGKEITAKYAPRIEDFPVESLADLPSVLHLISAYSPLPAYERALMVPLLDGLFAGGKEFYGEVYGLLGPHLSLWKTVPQAREPLRKLETFASAGQPSAKGSRALLASFLAEIRRLKLCGPGDEANLRRAEMLYGEGKEAEHTDFLAGIYEKLAKFPVLRLHVDLQREILRRLLKTPLER